MLVSPSITFVVFKTGVSGEDHLLVLLQFFQEVNPLTFMSDQDRISPYNINTISSRQVMRIKKNIN